MRKQLGGEKEKKKKKRIHSITHPTWQHSCVAVVQCVLYSTVSRALCFLLTPLCLGKANWELKQWQADISWLLPKPSPLLEWCWSPPRRILTVTPNVHNVTYGQSRCSMCSSSAYTVDYLFTIYTAVKIIWTPSRHLHFDHVIGQLPWSNAI